MEHYLRYFEEGWTLREFKQLVGHMKANRLFYAFRERGWIVKEKGVWILSRRGREAWLMYLNGDRS